MTDKVYIPLGFQCTVPTALKNIGEKSEALPFDWMLSSPKFIYEIMTMLLSGMPIKELVTEHFFNCTAKSTMLYAEHYVTDPNGSALYNEKYDVIFPHDVYDDVNIQKYIRRFERLYNLVKSDKNLVYIYIYPSSKDDGSFIINGRPIIKDTSEYLILTYELLKKHCKNNFEFKVLQTFDDLIDYSGIDSIFINPANHWVHILYECQYRLSEEKKR